MGSKEAGEMQFWTKDEYLRFSEAISDKPLAFYAFEVLYWMGIRCGELMALTPSDFLLETSELRIDKSYQRLRGEDVITKPKTRKSVRTIKMPAFLRDEMAEFIEMRARTSRPTSGSSASRSTSSCTRWTAAARRRASSGYASTTFATAT